MKTHRKNKVVIAGGSGFMGESFIRHFGDRFDEVVVLTRGNEKIEGKVKFVHWDGKTPTEWTSELNGADLLLNLCGRSVDCRYNEKNKKEILDSRIDSTTALGTAVIMASNPPKLWVNAASATIYRHAEDRPMTEAEGEIGNDFSVGVCKSWEKTFWDIPVPETRKVLLRTALVLGERGGVFERLTQLSRFGLGGAQGSGKQMMSWIHERDFCEIVMFMLQNDHLEGTFNAAAPVPVDNRDFMHQLRKSLQVPFGLPATNWMVEIGTFLMRTESELILKSRWVLPEKLQEAGYQFHFRDLKSAFEQLTDSKRVSGKPAVSGL
ncbi:TIGR01777 family oxidoreductase [Halocola ammonii]